MSGEQFLEKYQNRNWMFLMDNPDVSRFILSYPNERTRVNIAQAIYDLVREVLQTKPDFDVSTFLDMDSIEAREMVWTVIMSYIEKRKYRTAGILKVYIKLFYDYVHELRRDNQVILWKRRHQVPLIKTKKTEVPDHQQIYRLVDKTTHPNIQAIFLLSYSSGLKGSGIINLKVGHLREAMKFREKLRQEFINERRKTYDPKAQKDLDELITDLPLVLRITPQIYYKRFRNGGTNDWYPALITRDAEEVLMKYYNKKRGHASDEERLFVTRTGKNFTQVELSKALKYNINKFFKAASELEHTSPSLLRRSFYNRLIAGNMKDIFREYLMGHTLGVKGHYFDWESNKKEILLSYIRCNFNRIANDVTREITTLKEDSMSKDEKIKQLEEELSYFKSKEYTNSLVATVVKSIKTGSPFNVIDKKPAKTIKVAVPIESGKELKRLMNEGYTITESDSDNFYLEKEIE